MPNILDLLLETATNQIKNKNIIKNEKIKINKSKVIEKPKEIIPSTIVTIPKNKDTNIDNLNVDSKSNTDLNDIIEIITNFYENLIKQKYKLGLENTSKLKEYVDTLTLSENDIEDLMNQIKEIDSNLSDNEIEDLIQNEIDKLNAIENIDKIIFRLSESKEIAKTFRSYLEEKNHNI